MDERGEGRQLGPLPSYPDLAHKVAVVTGGSRGIGAATARALATNGVSVAVVGRDDGALEVVAAGIREGGGHALPVRADCTVEADVERAARTVTEQLGAPSIGAASAGGSGAPVPTVEESAARWRDVLETNLTSTFLTRSSAKRSTPPSR